MAANYRTVTKFLWAGTLPAEIDKIFERCLSSGSG
jgi:hypothetical protein